MSHPKVVSRVVRQVRPEIAFFDAVYRDVQPPGYNQTALLSTMYTGIKSGAAPGPGDGSLDACDWLDREVNMYLMEMSHTMPSTTATAAAAAKSPITPMQLFERMKKATKMPKARNASQVQTTEFPEEYFGVYQPAAQSKISKTLFADVIKSVYRHCTFASDIKLEVLRGAIYSLALFLYVVSDVNLAKVEYWMPVVLCIKNCCVSLDEEEKKYTVQYTLRFMASIPELSGITFGDAIIDAYYVTIKQNRTLVNETIKYGSRARKKATQSPDRTAVELRGLHPNFAVEISSKRLQGTTTTTTATTTTPASSSSTSSPATAAAAAAASSPLASLTGHVEIGSGAHERLSAGLSSYSEFVGGLCTTSEALFASLLLTGCALMYQAIPDKSHWAALMHSSLDEFVVAPVMRGYLYVLPFTIMSVNDNGAAAITLHNSYVDVGRHFATPVHALRFVFSSVKHEKYDTTGAVKFINKFDITL